MALLVLREAMDAIEIIGILLLVAVAVPDAARSP